MLTDQQTAMLDRARAATFGQLRQQHLTEAEHRDCAVLVAAGLLKDVVGTTFMLTEAGRRYWPGKDGYAIFNFCRSVCDLAGIWLRPSCRGIFQDDVRT